MEQCKLMVKGIVRSHDKFLIVAKWYDDCIANPYQWQFIDGDVEHGEAPDAAVMRLVLEQAGITAEINRIIYTWSFMIGDLHKVGIAYECIAEQDTVILSEELNDAKWISREEFAQYIDNDKVLEDFLKAEYE
ncbi:MAG: nucleoside triphosphatase [Clostridiales bacterium]|nr:nucleoside triphosphatase [Clostridiales bacterium]